MAEENASGARDTRAANYIGLRDLFARWVYTRQGIYKVMRYRDFPTPAFTVNAGTTKVWKLGDIEAFEKQHPELLSIAARDFKMKGYWLTIKRDRKGLQKRNKPV